MENSSMHPMVVQRADLLRQVRRFFDDRDYFEVQPPCLGRDCVVDVYLDPIRVQTSELGLATDDVPRHYFLQTSPESAMKRMLAGGAPSIYSIGPVFRSGEIGRHHNVEFTMLEWYQRDGNAESQIGLLKDLAKVILRRTATSVISYREAFRQSLGVDPIDGELQRLRSLVQQREPDLAQDLGDDRDGLLDVLFSERVIPKLTKRSSWIVRDYPLTQAALARRSARDPDCAERFEWFVDGIELANGYDELLDANELLHRYESNNRKREAVGRSTLETDTTLLAAMRSGLPQCAGVALGFDRLLMLHMGVEQIGDVIPLPIDRA
ncbi:EF-P lysine aminoacylase EpmA [Crateriforma spongiae]|uniref:EF-P lysine aminoacylase EpmA n=1 Tax=Crateriforma spongiae TaxID=2724528 RepID=UPI0014478563|nr:EF-P lysine aminoacylase EpmA [Crateriforma spongiae]